MRAIQKNFPNIVASQVAIDEKHDTRKDFRNILNNFKSESRSECALVLTLCGANLSRYRSHELRA